MTTPRSPNFSRAAAFHEAGHVVARLDTGLPATDAEIHSSGDGFTHGTGMQLQLDQYGTWNLLSVYLAGPYAEAKISRKSVAAVLQSAGSSDYLQAQCAIRHLVSHGYVRSEIHAWERAEQQAKGLLRRRWPAIRHFAQLLLDCGKLSAKQIETCWTNEFLEAGQTGEFYS